MSAYGVRHPLPSSPAVRARLYELVVATARARHRDRQHEAYQGLRPRTPAGAAAKAGACCLACYEVDDALRLTSHCCSHAELDGSTRGRR